MVNLDDKCYESKISTEIFNNSDDKRTLIDLANSRYFLGHDFGASNSIVYITENRFLFSKLLETGAEFTDLICFSNYLPKNLTVTPQHYGIVLDKIVRKDIPNITVITSNRQVTENLLRIEGLAEIIGKPDSKIPYIEANYAGLRMDIFTGN